MNVISELRAFSLNVFDDSFAKHLEKYKKFFFVGKGDYFEGKENSLVLSSCVICSYRSNLGILLFDLARFMVLMTACVGKRENFKAPCCVIL